MINSTVTNASHHHNGSKSHVLGIFDISMEDTNWIMTSSFIIFTMQTGFGMLESGCVSVKNEVNIMMKNVVDVALGGLTYWMFGFALSFGDGPGTNSFIAFGNFLVDTNFDDPVMGPVFGAFLFQLSFATTATTIVSGAMAERCNFKAYCLFSLMNTIVYCLPAGWVWGEHGFLNHLGVVDIAGSGPVHLIGGASALASAMMLGPRLGRYDNGTDALPLGCPVNAVLGLFVLWWGWMAFNAGSTYGVSGTKWEYSARAAVLTMLSSFGGGLTGLCVSMKRHDGRVDIIDMINGVLGSLVSITAGCFLYSAEEAILIGVIGGLLACLMMPVFDKLGIDDPVGASSVHGVCGIWGVLAVGIFARDPIQLATTRGRSGLIHGGGFYLLGVQTLCVVCLGLWGFLITGSILWIVNKIIPIRMEVHEELLGADLVEHMIRHKGVGIGRTMLILTPFPDQEIVENFPNVGENPGHLSYLERYERTKFEGEMSDGNRFRHVLHTPSTVSNFLAPSTATRRPSNQRSCRPSLLDEDIVKSRRNSRLTSVVALENTLNDQYLGPDYAWVE